MPKKLTDIQLWEADRSAEITLPETFFGCFAKNAGPHITKELGKFDKWTMELRLVASSELALATTSDDYYLSKRKIIRLVYDDSSIEEWMIRSRNRQTSGEQDFVITCEYIVQQLKGYTLRQELTTGEVRDQVTFYRQDVDTILTAILSSTYNCPALFTKGTIDSTIGAKELQLEFDGNNFLQVLNAIAVQSESEWGISYDAINDDYEIDFYEIGDLGGGSSQAGDRLIQMGDGKGNRINLLQRNTQDALYSRLIPRAGQSSETRGIGDLTFDITLDSGSTYDLDKDVILVDDFLLNYQETVYLGNATDGWEEVTDSVAPNSVTLNAALTQTEPVRFGLGASKKKLTYLESPDAVTDVGVIEKVYRRTDINPYTNLIKQAGVSDDLSQWSTGLPVGVSKVGTPTVAEETGSQYVKFGSSSAKCTADADEGLECSVDVEANELYALTVYVQLGSGSIKVQFEDGSSVVLPEGEYAESDSSELQGLTLEGIKPTSTGSATISVIALEASTVFYLDAWVLTKSGTAQQFSPLMGALDLWTEAGKDLIQNSGSQPDQYTGTFWDDAYDDALAKEVTVGSWVTVKDAWDGTTHNINFTGRVLRLSYTEDKVNGRNQKRNVQISNRPQDLNSFLTDTFVTRNDEQQGSEVGLIQALNALQLAIKNGSISIARDGTITIPETTDFDQPGSFRIGDAQIRYDSSTNELIIGTITNNDIRIDAGGASTSKVGDVIIDLGGFVPPSNYSYLVINNLRTTDPGGTGRVWNDSGTLKIT